MWNDGDRLRVTVEWLDEDRDPITVELSNGTVRRSKVESSVIVGDGTTIRQLPPRNLVFEVSGELDEEA